MTSVKEFNYETQCVVCQTKLNKKFKRQEVNVNFKNKNNGSMISWFLKLPNDVKGLVCDVCNNIEIMMRIGSKDKLLGVIKSCNFKGYEFHYPRNFEMVSIARQRNIEKFIKMVAYEVCE